MSANKAALKAAKAALDGRNYDDAVKEAEKVLDNDPKHYHANVFRGLALERLDKYEDAEAAYNKALKTKDDDSLAWQGLITLYEKQASKKIDEYGAAVSRLSEIWMQADDKYKCQYVVDKFVGYAKAHGTKDQYRRALDLILPNSPIYDYLEGRLPHPSQTYPKIVEIIEADEKARINRLIGERRTRLGAKVGQVTLEVKREVYQASPLEDLYSQVINWTNEDEMRRHYEEKLLQRAYDILEVIPEKEKGRQRAQVQKLAEGLVILKHAFVLAWSIALEWKDIEEVKELDKNLLYDFMELFPEDGLTKVIRGYLGSEISPFPLPEQTNGDSSDSPEEDEALITTTASEHRLIMMSEGSEQSSRSILSQRLMAEYLLHLEEWAAVVETSKKMKALLVQEQQVSGLGFQNSFDAANIMLGTALVRFQSPRHHAEARQLFDNVLERKIENSSALIGVGLILEEEDDYSKATEFLLKALERGAGIKIKAEAAWCMAQNKDYESGLQNLEECLEELDKPESDRTLKAEVLYRIGICLWNLSTSKVARKDRTRAYARFISALQANLNHAPSYTSLGIYYSDYSKDKKRARKCFQKAFELSSSEVEAAERLARAFAEQSEWDLVEVVSQRVIDSGKVRPPPGSKKRGLSWPFAALGVCQLNNQNYPHSVASFQSALRIAPSDIHSWIGLGESYHNSGRFIAATKAFEHAQKLQEETGSQVEDGWFSKYMLANVRRELRDYAEAIDGYNNVLALRPTEFGVANALLQTYVESSWQSIELGLYGRAAESSSKAITAAINIIEHKPNVFNVWKTIGDACSSFSYIASYSSDMNMSDLLKLLSKEYESAHYAALSDVDNISLKTLQNASKHDSLSLLHASILAHKRALHCCANDIHAQAVAWYNLGWAEYRTYAKTKPTSPPIPKTSMAFLKAAVRSFKRAIELEAGNSEFWNALGLVTSPLNARVAQHAFSRSLYLNDKSAKVWTNLGVFYLQETDTELANEAFTRGQSADPDYAQAWVGQGMLALLIGEKREAHELFTHAFEIADSSEVATKRLYADSAFDQALGLEGELSDVAELLRPLFALQQTKVQAPGDKAARHLAALFAERAGDHSGPVEMLIPLCEQLEADYETHESPEILAQFAQAKADLARAFLAIGDYEAAIENAETALDLSADEDSGSPDQDARQKYRLSAHLTSGLAANYLSDMDKAISMFRTALEESNGNADTVCVLAQVLWAKGGEQERNVAREQLLDCIENHPTHPGAISLLAVIAILDNDQDTLEAVTADLHTLRTREDLDAHEKLRTGKLLAAIAMLQPQGDRETAEIADATSAVMLTPFQSHGWSQLAGLAEDGNSGPAEMAVLTARGAIPPKGALDAADLSEAFAGTTTIADAQRSVMVAPWMPCGWQSLTA